MKYKFKEIELAPFEELWLQEVYESEKFDVKKAKIKLWDKLPKGFDPRSIDSRLYAWDHLTLIGIWYIDPESKVFENVERVIKDIREQIINAPGIETVSAKDISTRTGIEEKDIEIAMCLMCDLGKFMTSASGTSGSIGYKSLTFSGENAYDAYLAFDSIKELMEDFYRSNAPSTKSSDLPGFTPDQYQQNTAFIIMPIDPNKPELEDVCNTIKDVCKQFDIKAYRADDIQHQESITDIVLKQIRESEFLIADLSYERPNVYYEIGYAHAIGKHPILFRKQDTKLHFDLSIHNVPEYRNISDLKSKLVTRFEAIFGRKPGKA